VSLSSCALTETNGTRGGDERSGSLFSYVDLEARVGEDHPLRIIRGAVNEALAELSGEFSALYSRIGRPSIPPEKLLRAMLLHAFYSIRSERQLMERLEFDLLFRWFVGLGVDDGAWDHSTVSKNRERLLEGDIAAKLLTAVIAQPRVKRLLSTDHFSVDGTLIEAWASMKSFRPKDGSDEPRTADGGRNREVDFHGQKRSNETHASTTDPEARLYRKGPGKEAKLHGTRADGEPQRPRCRRLLDRGQRSRRADRGAAHDRAARRPAACGHAGRRQGLRTDCRVTPVHFLSSATPTVTATPTTAVTTAEIVGRKASTIGPSAIAESIMRNLLGMLERDLD
jgi:transposase